MSDLIVVMKSGTIQQVGAPQDVYNEPANAFVADFIGEANLFDASMEQDREVTLSGASFACVDPRPCPLVDAVIRPEDVEITAPEAGTVQGKVLACLFKGVHYEITVEVGSDQWIIHSTRSAQVGGTVGLTVAPENIHIMRRMFPGAENELQGRVLADTQEGLTPVEIRGKRLEVPTRKSYREGETASFLLDPRAIELCQEEEGLFSGVLDSVVWKANHYEMILISDQGAFLVKRTMDEQAGTTVGLHFDPAALREA